MKTRTIIVAMMAILSSCTSCKKDETAKPKATELPVSLIYTSDSRTDSTTIYYSFGGDTTRLRITGNWQKDQIVHVGKIAYLRAVSAPQVSSKLEIDILGKMAATHSSSCVVDKSISKEVKDYWDYSLIIR